MGACPDHDRLAAFVAGELAEEERAAFESHLKRCAACDDAVSLLAYTFAVSVDDEGRRSPPPSSLPRPGDAVGRFEVLEFIGGGAMGAVFRARDPELDRPIALKFFHPYPGLTDEDARPRFSSEARLVASIRHPHVVTVHDVGTMNGIPFFAMEFIDGCSLGQWLGSPRSLEEVLETFMAAGRGLAAAHQVGLVHRDFKPDNVLIGVDGEVKVIDFCLASARARESLHECDAEESLARTRQGSLIGTPSYMAPEQLRGEHSDARSDQFAFCLVLYEALCGRPAFPGSDLAQLQRRVGRTRPSWERHDARTGVVPRRVRAAVERGLSFVPDERFASMTDLLRKLRPRRRCRAEPARHVVQDGMCEADGFGRGVSRRHTGV